MANNNNGGQANGSQNTVNENDLASGQTIDGTKQAQAGALKAPGPEAGAPKAPAPAAGAKPASPKVPALPKKEVPICRVKTEGGWTFKNIEDVTEEDEVYADDQAAVAKSMKRRNAEDERREQVAVVRDAMRGR